VSGSERWTTRDFIVALRGGVPKGCDFCQKPTAPEKLHPEEAGMWVCEECLAKWEEDEKR